jgi:hypothetical protein
VIVAQVLTDAAADDAKNSFRLIEDTPGNIASVTADASYDTIAFYEAARGRGAKLIVPPIRTAKVTRRGPRSEAHDRAISQRAGHRDRDGVQHSEPEGRYWYACFQGGKDLSFLRVEDFSTHR